MRARVLATTITLAIVAWTPAAAASTSQARIHAFLRDHWPRGASGTVLVARGDRALTCEGFGWADRAHRIRAGCDTGYDIMSMTKQFTAAAILKLQMLGRLSVDDHLDRFFAGVPGDKRAITIADLLDQTSGVVEVLGGDYEPLSREQLVAKAMAAPLRSPPGTAYHYSNVGFSLLAAIVEKASGTTYERFLRRRLFLPAGMRHTGYVLPRWRRHQVAIEYDGRGRAHGRPFQHPWADDGPYWNLRGNGGIISTARDLLRWHRALLGERVLDAHARLELFTPRFQYDPGAWSAFGWDVLSTSAGPVAIHNGGNAWSFGVIARLLRQDALVFWISNHARQAGRWNLQRLEQRLTQGLAVRAL